MVQKQLLEQLQVHSFARREVTLASGAKSDWFVDCKQAVLRAEGHRLAGQVLLEEIRARHPQAQVVAGVALGGCPLASSVAFCSTFEGIPLDAFYVRKRTKSHGSARAIEGDDQHRDGARVVVVEDVVTSGGSTLQAVQQLRAAKHQVIAVLALVDREAGGEEALGREGLPFYAFFRRADFFGQGRRNQ